jgi:hypothetical protein
MTTNFQLEHYLINTKNFLGVFASDKLPLNPSFNSSLIVNYSKSGERGSHWVAMRGLNTNNSEYFDSYGFDPDDDDLLLGTTTKFKQYLSKNSKGNYTVNMLNFQQLTSDVCGEYAAWFIKYGLPELSYNGKIIVNPKWRDLIKNNNSFMNDKLIKKMVGIR